MARLSDLFHPKSLRDGLRRAATAAAGVVVGTWFAAYLSQFSAFKNPNVQVAAVMQFFIWLMAAPWFVALSGLIIGFTLGVWLDAYLVRRARRRWWEGLHTLTIKSFSCLVAGVPEGRFEASPRAAAVAAEILSYVNSGHMGLALEMPLPGASEFGPRYCVKTVGPEAIVFKKDLERLAPSRRWELPWPIEPSQPVAIAKSSPVESGILGSELLNALYGHKK
jgi:hypothetical protein